METMLTPTSQDRPTNPSISPADAIDALGRGAFKIEHLQALSDLGRADARNLARAWPNVPTEERISIVRRLEQIAEDNVEFLFGRVFRIALTDASPVVRQIAISGLWEDESSDLIDSFTAILAEDESEDVRAAAASALARFADLAATEELDVRTAEKVRNALSSAASLSEASVLVRRRALESVAIFGPSAGVNDLISTFFDADDSAERASALYAMGRCLDRTWLPTVLSELESDDAELRFEAARASGELGHGDAVPGLTELIHDSDAEVRQAAIASLGKIGGTSAIRVLESYLAVCPASVRELVDDALHEARIFNETPRAGM
jgi:HEAT repeat protein